MQSEYFNGLFEFFYFIQVEYFKYVSAIECLNLDRSCMYCLEKMQSECFYGMFELFYSVYVEYTLEQVIWF